MSTAWLGGQVGKINMSKCIDKYNKMCLPEWRVKSKEKAFLLSLAKCPATVFDRLQMHYGLYKIADAGKPAGMLA